MYVHEVHWESGRSRGTGQEGKVWYKSRIHFLVSRQGLCFPWGICKCMNQIKMQVKSNHFLKLYMSKLNGTQEEKFHLIWVLRVKYTYIFLYSLNVDPSHGHK